MSRRHLYAAWVLVIALSAHRPALAQISDPGPSGGGTCRPAVPEAGMTYGYGTNRLAWPGLRGTRGSLGSWSEWSSRLWPSGRSFLLVRRRAGQ